MVDFILHPKRELSLLRRHPWVFSNAIARMVGMPYPGDTVRILSDKGAVLGYGSFSPLSQIQVRMWTFDGRESVDEALIERLVAESVGRRAVLVAEDFTDALRLINAEADGIPGCVVDKYGDWLVCSFTAAGAERWKREIVGALRRLLPSCKGVYERSDADARSREGLEPCVGTLAGEEPPERIEIREGNCRFLVDVRAGHKTGFYLDQRENRAKVAACANGAEVLNAFSYTGGFGIAALAAGAASVTHVDLSEPALAIAKANTERNAICTMGKSEFICGNVFEVLRKFRDQGRTFDLIVLDPPKFVSSKAALQKASRGYKDINLLGIKLLRPGGTLATFSCSERMSPDFFRTVVMEAALDARRDLRIVSRLQQAQDHPEGIFFPEGLYLKGLLCSA